MTDLAMCIETFEILAESNPLKLLMLVANGKIDSADLSIAAEILGKSKIRKADNVLIKLLKHESPLVREGAIYGLWSFYEYGSLEASYIKEAINNVAKNDKSEIIKEIAVNIGYLL